MAQRSLREFDSKTLLHKWIPTYTNEAFTVSGKFVQVYAKQALRPRSSSSASVTSPRAGDDDGDDANAAEESAGKYLSVLRAAEQHEWLRSERLVVKVDQLIKRRGKAGLLLLNATLEEAHAWIEAHSRSTVRPRVDHVALRGGVVAAWHRTVSGSVAAPRH